MTCCFMECAPLTISKLIKAIAQLSLADTTLALRSLKQPKAIDRTISKHEPPSSCLLPQRLGDVPPERTWKHVEIFPGSGERTLEHSKSHLESLTSRTCPEPPNWSPVAVVDGHMMHTATAVQHNVDVQSLDGAPSGVLRDGEIQNSLLCSPGSGHPNEDVEFLGCRSTPRDLPWM